MVRDPALRRVKADPGQIEQDIMNLVVNVRDAMPPGGTLAIRTTNLELEKPDIHTRFTVPPGSDAILVVSDTGIGMDVETQARIVECSLQPKLRGTRLGLPTMYGM